MNRNLDWAVLTLVIVLMGAFGIFLYGKVDQNNDLIETQMKTSTERYTSNRVLLEKLGEQTADRWTKSQHDRWCVEATKLNPGWTCPSD